MQSSLLPTLLVSLGLSVVFAACGNDGDTTGPDLGNFPIGTYSKTLTATDVPDGYDYMVGTLITTFRSDGSWDTRQDGQLRVNGLFTISGSQLSITDGGGYWSCAQVNAATGTYTWSFNGTNLTLTVISDDCSGRQIGLTTKPLVKQ